MRMHTGRLSILTWTAALLLGSILLATTPAPAQEKPAPPAEPSVEPAASQEPAQGAQKPEASKEKRKKGAAVKRDGVPLEEGSTLPPRNLKKVGDHWTPYDPPDPESFPPDATLHIIVPGDTLWDLADLVFGNPYLWPQIWNENRYILDSHWIYPGDPLLLPARPTVVGEVVPQGQEGAPPAPQAATPEPESEDEEEVPTAEAPHDEQASAAPTHTPTPGSAHAPRSVPKIEPLADD